ncbi:MAG: hypothetical protein LBJ15_18180 [Comamonas sp.]|jgi:hypothetical protein|uniref:LPD38 domain-containing protein n=1 Tax=Comamonas sp. TaxID=34028 RepID=UPI00283510C2|nr:LPD38 domain-containing protein [Comamonas sp.]MDR0215905.1 hypothetical protein [Comamonas sp.]
MAQSNDWWKQGSTPIESSSPTGEWWKQGAEPLDAAQKPTGGTISDLGKSLKAGVQRLPGMVTGLADLPIAAVTGARPFTKAADALGEATGFQPGKWADDTKFSAGYEQGKQAVDEAWKDGSVGEIALAYLKNPGYTANQVAESLPGMVAGGLAGRALMGVGRTAGVAAKAGGVGPAAPGALARTVGEKMAAPVAAGIGEGAVTAGQQMAQYQGEDQQKNALASLGAGLGTAALGVGAGRAANKLGLETAETAIINAGRKGAAHAADEVPLSAQRRILGGMVSEAVLQELPQSAQEQMWQNYAEGKPLMEGVARAATEGAIAGGVMGAGANVSDGGAGKRRAQAEQLARQNAEGAAASADALAEEARNAKPLMLGNDAPSQLFVFPDGTVGRTGEVESYLANLPEEQRADARAKLLGQSYTEVNDTQAQQARRWWENYGDGAQPSQSPDYLAEVQQAVRSGTPFSTQQTVDTVRNAMEDAWLAQNVGAEAAAPGVPAQAADAMGAQLQTEFEQAGGDAAVAAVDARVRTGRILSGLQNLLDAGADNTIQVLGGLNEGLGRINEQPLDQEETGRVRRIVDAYMGFRGVGEPAALPADRAASAVDQFADNGAMESLIPERPSVAPSVRMGLNPAAGPLSRGAAMAVDAGFVTGAPVQEAANAQGPQTQASGMAAAATNTPTGPGPLEAAGSVNSQPNGVTLASQADQAQQAGPQSSQATGAPRAQDAGPATAQDLIHDTVPTANNENQGKQAKAQKTQAQAATESVANRPENWRTSMLRAGPVAKGLGIDPKGKRLAQLVAEIDAADAARTSGPEAVPVGNVRGEAAESLGQVTGREVSRDIGRHREGLSEFRANQVRAELARRNPGVAYTVEEDASLKNGYAVVGRGQAAGNLQMSRQMPAELAQALQALRPPRAAATVDSVRSAVRSLVSGGALLPNRLGRVVVATSDEIKSQWEPLIGPVAMGSEAEGKAQGFYDPQTKTVFLIADHIQAGDELGVVAHELMHKHGPAVLGEEGWSRLHGAIEAWAGAEPGSMERQVYDEAAARVRESHPAGAEERGYSSQELFPYAVQVALELGVRPNALAPQGTVARWLGQVKAMLREVWKKIAGGKSDFNSQDLVNLAFGIAQRENPAHAGELDGAIAPLRTATNFLQARQAVKEFQGKELTNAATGMTAVVSRNTLDKMLSGKAVGKSETPATHSMAVANADSLFKRAILGWSKPDRADDLNIRAIHRFFAPLEIDGRAKLVKLTVKETTLERANSIYTLEAVELNENVPAEEWLQAAAREDGVDLETKNPLQRGVGPRENQQAASRETLAQPHGVTPGRSAEDVRSLAQAVERSNSGGSTTMNAETSSAQHPDAQGDGGTGPSVEGAPAPGKLQFSRVAASSADTGYTAAQQRAAERVFGVQIKETLVDRAKAMRHNLGTKLRQGLVDQFAPIKEVSEKAYILARLSKGSDGAVEAALLYGKPFLRDGVADVDVKDGGFAKVLASLKGEDSRFFQWVAAQRAERLKAEGKENLLTDQDITALKSLNAGQFSDGTPRMPTYAAALRELNAFNEASLKVAKDSGLIDQAAHDLMKDQPYVPFYRLMEEDGGMRGPRFSSGLVNQQAWKKLKGGTQQLNADLLQNTLMNWSHLYAAAARNRASLETMAAADQMGIAYKVPADTKGSIKVMRDGAAEHWAVEDPYLLDAISAMSYAPGGIVKAMAPFKRLLTFGVTVNPTFKIRNLIRDTLSAMAQGDLSYNPLENVAKGWKATGKDTQTYASMLASGGIIKFGTQENTDRVRAQIGRLGGEVLNKSGFGKLKGQMKSLWEVYEEFGDRTENVNRAALYERLIAKGHSHAEAAFMARDLMDFSMSGKWETVRFLTQTVPFLNARLQGLYKLGRAAKADPRRFAAMAGAVSLASLGLLAAYSDDEDWKKREDWDRDNFWWFKVGDKAFRIPKPFEVGAIGTVAERTAELMLSEEMTGKRFGQRISDMVFNTFAMDPTPQFIKPFIDVYANKDSFSGRPIEGMADERLRPQDRYNERNSEVARMLGSWGLPDPVRLAKGEYSGLSPKQIDFLLRGYFGWLATVSTTASDTLVRPMLDRGERPAMRLRDTFLAGNFVESLPTGSSRYVSTMYEQAKDVEQAWASYQAAQKSGDIELARSIQEAEGSKLRNRFAVANAKQQIAELGQQAKKIEGNRLMSADAKRERLDELEARKHQVARRLAGLTATR